MREEVAAVRGATETVIADTLRDVPTATLLDTPRLEDMVDRDRDMEVGMGMEEVEAMDRVPARPTALTTAAAVTAAAARRVKARRSST